MILVYTKIKRKFIITNSVLHKSFLWYAKYVVKHLILQGKLGWLSKLTNSLNLFVTTSFFVVESTHLLLTHACIQQYWCYFHISDFVVTLIENWKLKWFPIIKTKSLSIQTLFNYTFYIDSLLQKLILHFFLLELFSA